MGEILTHLSLLMPAFSLVCSPQFLSILLLPTYNAPLPLDLIKSTTSVLDLAPEIFGAKSLDQ